VKTHFGRIVREVAITGTPVVIRTHGEDQAVIISLRDFQKPKPVEEERPISQIILESRNWRPGSEWVTEE
jgi:prevent-host-death family protein